MISIERISEIVARVEEQRLCPNCLANRSAILGYDGNDFIMGRQTLVYECKSCGKIDKIESYTDEEVLRFTKLSEKFNLK